MNPARPSFAPALEPEVTGPQLPELGEQVREISSADRALVTARLLWEHRQFVWKFVWRGALFFTIVALLIPASYDSRTQLMPPDQHASGALGMLAAMTGGIGGGGGGGAMSMLSDLLGIKTSGDLFISILKSDTVEDHIIDRFDLRKLYWVSTYKAARKKLSNRTDVKEDKKSGVISIEVSDRDPRRAAAIAQAYVDELNRMVVELNTSSAHRERVFLEGRLKVVKENLDTASKAFSEFASHNTAIDIKEQGKAMVEAAATLQGELIAAQSELNGLEQIYTPNNVRVRSLQARVAELQRQLQKLGGSPADDSSGANPDQIYPSIRQLPVLGVPYYNLYRDVRINETVYEVLTKEYEIARVEEAKEVPSVKVIDPARPPEKRSGPPRTLIILGGVLLSFCLAGAFLFGREAWRNTDPQDPRKQLATEVAGTIGRKLPLDRARQLSARFNSNGHGSDTDYPADRNEQTNGNASSS